MKMYRNNEVTVEHNLASEIDILRNSDHVDLTEIKLLGEF